MDKFIRLSEEEKRDIFQTVGIKKGLRPDIIEKDYWVCFMLEYLFHISEYKKAFVFKGGTSLSKAFHVIERFSEDIDIILDWRELLTEVDLPWQERSKTKQDKYNKMINQKAIQFFDTKLVPSINKDLIKILGEGQWVAIDDTDNMVINFYYPQLFEIDYLRDKVRLEIGPLAEWVPSHDRKIQSFVSETFPELFNKTSANILTIDAERTFWEKLTILHKMAYLPESKNIPSRYARHLYDVYCMSNSPIKEQAYVRKELLEKDIKFKQKFYYSKSAYYELATLKDIRLIPAKHIMSAVKKDYDAMKNMVYGYYPEFNDILITLGELEKEIHKL